MKWYKPMYLTIRSKLLLVILALLLIPWMGYHYVREMKSFLLQGQEDVLLLTARAVATVLHGRDKLFSKETGVPKLLGDQTSLYAYPLTNLIVLDGKMADWGKAMTKAQRYVDDAPLQCTAAADPDNFSFYHILGYYKRYIYAFFEVTDDQVVLRDPALLRLDNSDQIRLIVEDSGGTLRRYLLVARKPGRMSVYLMDKSWKYSITGEPFYDIAAVLIRTQNGYTVEARIPRYIINAYSKAAFRVVDVDDRKNRKIVREITTSPDPTGQHMGRVLLHSPEISNILIGLNRPSARIWILDKQQRVRAVVGGFSSGASLKIPLLEDQQPWLVRWFGKLMTPLYHLILNSPPVDFKDIPEESEFRRDPVFTDVLAGKTRVQRRPSVDGKALILMAAHPVWSGGKVMGAVIVEQSSNDVLALQEKTLENMTTFSLLVFLFLATVLLMFAWRLTMRIAKMRNETEKAISPEGRVVQSALSTNILVRDELGDLSRSISNMLGRLSQYTQYLESMPDTLAHELNNPLNVVHSSLENLLKEHADIGTSKYLKRAQNGVTRLKSILVRLTEAMNLEEAIQNEDLEVFDLASLVKSYLDGYRLTLQNRSITLQINDELRLPIEGSPDHIAQMLDKLIDNAAEFGSEHEPIVVRMEQQEAWVCLHFINQGSPIPEDLLEHIFEPMISISRPNALHAHLGLGLYIVKLIVNHHHGTVQAKNVGDPPHVEILVRFPVFSSLTV